MAQDKTPKLADAARLATLQASIDEHEKKAAALKEELARASEINVAVCPVTLRRAIRYSAGDDAYGYRSIASGTLGFSILANPKTGQPEIGRLYLRTASDTVDVPFHALPVHGIVQLAHTILHALKPEDVGSAIDRAWLAHETRMLDANNQVAALHAEIDMAHTARDEYAALRQESAALARECTETKKAQAAAVEGEKAAQKKTAALVSEIQALEARREAIMLQCKQWLDVIEKLAGVLPLGLGAREPAEASNAPA